MVFLSTLGSLLGSLWLLLSSFWCLCGSNWSPLGSFWRLCGSNWAPLPPFWADFRYFAPSWLHFGPLWAKIMFLSTDIAKNQSCIDPGIKFLANFRMQTIFPRPGGGTIAVGNRDRCPEKGRLQDAPRYSGDWVFGAPLVEKVAPGMDFGSHFGASFH